MAHIMTEEEKKAIKGVTRFFCRDGDIRQFTDGRLEQALLITGRHNPYGASLQSQATVYDYNKPFDFNAWLAEQKPIKAEKSCCCQFFITDGDLVLMDPWLKKKLLDPFFMGQIPMNYKTFGTDPGPIPDLLYFLDNLLYDNEGNLVNPVREKIYQKDNLPDDSTSEILRSDTKTEIVLTKISSVTPDHLKSQQEWQEYVDKKGLKIFEDSNLCSQTTEELYQYDKDFRSSILIIWEEGEEWDIGRNTALCILSINQALYKFVARDAKEVRGDDKDEIFDDLYRNRIYVLKQRAEIEENQPLAKQRRDNIRAFYNSRAYYKVKDSDDDRKAAEEFFNSILR